MNTFCLIAVIVAIFVSANNGQHQAGAKPGDLVHWTVGANSKGATQLNHTGTVSFKAATVTTAKPGAPIVGPTVAAVAKIGEEVKPLDGSKPTEAATTTAGVAGVADAAGVAAAAATPTVAAVTAAPSGTNNLVAKAAEGEATTITPTTAAPAEAQKLIHK